MNPARFLRDRLKETEMEQLFDEIEMPLVFTLYDMEQNGVKVAAEALHIYGEQLGPKDCRFGKRHFTN